MADFMAYATRHAPRGTASSSAPVYIAKPDTGCQGRGIFLFRDVQRVSALDTARLADERLMVQRYVHRVQISPMLAPFCALTTLRV